MALKELLTRIQKLSGELEDLGVDVDVKITIDLAGPSIKKES